MSVHNIPHKFKVGDPVRVYMPGKPMFYAVITWVDKYIDPSDGKPKPNYSARKVQDENGDPIEVPKLNTTWRLGEPRMRPARRFDWTNVNAGLFHPMELSRMPREIADKIHGVEK